VVVDPLPTVRARLHEFRRLIQNLVGNAVKHAGRRRPVVHVTARETADGWEVSVIDNGVGVDSAERELIFKMFHRPAVGRSADGTGMGLAICERIVERHGGRIWVEPAPGGGSAFRFTLPDHRRAPVLREAA
jgi:signal transduction histidine kinase